MTPGPDGKRHLPVLKSSDGDEEQRPALQWIVIGAVATLIIWYPLTMLNAAWAKTYVAGVAAGASPEATREALLSLSTGQRITLSLIMVVGPMAVLGLSALLGGLIVGRFGGEAGKREGTLAGTSAAVFATLVSATQMIPAGQSTTWLWSAAIIISLASVSGRGGAALGLRLRG